MKKISLVKRVLSLVMALSMCIAMNSVTVFAAEEETPENPVIIDESVGNVLCYGSADFVNSTTIYVTLSSGNWSADCLVAITGNPGALYKVDMTTPGNTTHTDYITSGSGTYTNIKTLTYASKGTYKFKITRLSGSANSAHAVVEICD